VFGGWLSHRLPTTLSGVALSWRAPVDHRGGVWLKRGLPKLEVALPTSPDTSPCTARRATVGPVIIGMDPHKRSATIEIIDHHERVLRTGRFGTDQQDYQWLWVTWGASVFAGRSPLWTTGSVRVRGSSPLSSTLS
jgi:hypothetical protein